MVLLYVLFESASGYALFKRTQVDEIADELEEVQQSIMDFGKFKKCVSLKAFRAFTSAENALENINHISEGLLHETLKEFLELQLPSTKKRSKMILGVAEEKIGGAIGDQLGVTCKRNKHTLELTRGIRQHFTHFIKELRDGQLEQAQLGLGHSYSRAKVKFNVNRVDNMIIQSIALLDQLDKDINTFSMRIREWYSWHFPELIRIVPDNYLFAKAAALIGDKTEINEDVVEKLGDMLMDEDKAQEIWDAAKASMGTDISTFDMENITVFCERVVRLAEYRKKLHAYLFKKMNDVAPNLAALIGELVGARLISHAGSLTNLAKYPASTVQILGAEKALFRALKTRGNTPKYGLIFHSSFIGRAGSKNKGRISRYLANKCSIASRLDCFLDEPTNKYGEKLKEQVEERLKFYDTGVAPRKNVDVMKEVYDELNPEGEKKKSKKDKKKKKKSKDVEEDDEMNSESDEEEEEEKKKKKKKSKKDKKKGKKRKREEDEDDDDEDEKMEQDSPPPKKKSKKNKKDKKKKKKKVVDSDSDSD